MITGRGLVVLIALAGWLGAAVLVAGVVAPAAFAVLPSRDLAGALVGRVLPVLFVTGMAVGMLPLILHGRVPRSRAVVVLGIAMVVACAAAQFVVGRRIAVVRAAIAGPVDGLAVDDPHRRAFGRLHGASVGLLGAAMLAAVVAAGIVVRASQSSASEVI